MRNLCRMVEVRSLERTDASKMIASMVTSMRARWAVDGGGEHNLLIHIDSQRDNMGGIRLIFEIREDRHEKNILEVLGTIMSFDRPTTKINMVDEARDFLLGAGYPVSNDLGYGYEFRTRECQWLYELLRLDRR